MSLPGPFSWKNGIELHEAPFTPAQLAKLRGAFPAVDSMGIALVDLSRAPSIAYSLNFTKTAYAASLVKIAAMYAAFELQDRVKAAAGAAGARSLAELEQRLRKDWGPVLKRTVPRAVNDFPRLDLIFQSVGGGFHSAFHNDLKLMLGKSDNDAAGRCIRRIGYDYLNGSLVHAGFYSAADASGMWLAGDYVPAQFVKKVDGKTVKTRNPHNRDGVVAPGLKTTQAASAKSVATLLVNLAAGTLISADPSKEMKKLMTNTWLRDHVQEKHPHAEVHGKLGMLWNHSTDDCAIIKHSRAHYAVVALFGPFEVLDPLFEALDEVAEQIFTLHRKVGSAVRAAGDFFRHIIH